MGEYLVSARKYRPIEFDDVIGQKHITQTLKNAIKNQQIAHAYLFCGPRGVGKTTCARIFAKYVNSNTNSEYNIFELDGASNNSVDDIRNLIDQVKIPPQIGKYKIYIIDEVHMLSKAAFNAFLKTLEEPPKHSIFILATTEKNKIIPTILSRCQIFDFNRITQNQITHYLMKIAREENIEVNENTMQLIADKADGALRDALSIFDRTYTLCNDNWKHQEVAKILLSLDTEFAIDLVNNILKKQISTCLLKINKVIETGFESKEIVRALITHFRNLIAAKEDQTISLIYEKQETINKLIIQTKEISNQEILLALECLNDCYTNYHHSINQRFLVELCVMRLCSISDLDIKKKLQIPKNDNIIIDNKDTIKENDQLVKNITPKEEETKNKDIKPKLNTNNQSDLDQKTKIKQNNINSDLISISEELNFIDKKTEVKEKTEKQNWNQEELLKKWGYFSERLKKNQKTNLHNIFERHLPKKNENEIIIEVVSLSEKSEIEEVKADLLEFLKKELQNDFINIRINVSKEETKNMLHSKEEKYKYIVEQNNKVQLLQKELNLNII
ncbi:MAG: DNA polymerase III, subunit gamma and tau [Flavobacteriales bacterium]|nr:DNA polymerase III, subunit gamma and tau [Flavobacteriales bacterium]